MARDEEPLEEPFVTAGFVPTDDPEVDAIDVLVLWDDVSVVGDLVAELFDVALDAAMEEPRWGGEIRVVVPVDFLPENRANRRGLEAALQRWSESLAGRTTAAGKPLTVSVRREHR